MMPYNGTLIKNGNFYAHIYKDKAVLILGLSKTSKNHYKIRKRHEHCLQFTLQS